MYENYVSGMVFKRKNDVFFRNIIIINRRRYNFKILGYFNVILGIYLIMEEKTHIGTGKNCVFINYYFINSYNNNFFFIIFVCKNPVNIYKSGYLLKNIENKII